MAAKRILMVAGKGGTGKTTVVLSLALWWLRKGMNVGILDANLSSPDIPFYLGLPVYGVDGLKEGIEPLRPVEGLEVLSMGLFLDPPHTPVSWRGPIRHGVLKQFLFRARWGDLDVLLVDLPPGIGEEHMTLGNLLSEKAHVLLVSDFSKLALLEVKRLATFFRPLKVRPIGLVLNRERWRRPKGLDLKLLGALPYDYHLAGASRREGAFLVGEVSQAYKASLRALARRCLKAMDQGAEPPLTLQARLLFKGG